ncbi:TorF family putative porin [Arenimonas alkanexedens]
MKHKNLSLALAAALLALPMLASAQDEMGADADQEESSIYSWNAAVTSDYVFRGVSQTDEEPALQLGADLNFDSGFYVGAWLSNVDFGAGSPDVEIDTYLGWTTDFAEDWNFDIQVNRYNYIGEDDSFGDGDYNELITTVSWAETLSFTWGFTNDVYALGERGQYFGLGGSFDVGADIGLDLGVGMSTFDNSTGYDNYRDWSISLNRDFGPVNAALGYYDTDGEGNTNFGDTADGRVVLTFSIGG